MTISAYSYAGKSDAGVAGVAGVDGDAGTSMYYHGDDGLLGKMASLE
ncbi:hypothetical protein [Enterobacter asburiae]